MAKAKKLPSGQWRTLVYSHTETVDGKAKRIYESFTADSKKESEYLAAEFAQNKERLKNHANMTLREAIEKYTELCKKRRRSLSTIQGYEKMSKSPTSFAEIMDLPLKKITAANLQSAVDNECQLITYKGTIISPKTVRNRYGLISAAANEYAKMPADSIVLPTLEEKLKELLPPEIIYEVVKGTRIELACLLAMWLSFSISEIRGLTKSKSLRGNYLYINEAVIDINNKPVRQRRTKTSARKRVHQVPPYIMELINAVEGDVLVPYSQNSILKSFLWMLKKNGLPHMTFHDLRHVNASVMALLQLPDKYALERGGWKTDSIMKKVYTHTFSEHRKRADKTMDDFFEKTVLGQNMQHEMQHEGKETQ